MGERVYIGPRRGRNAARAMRSAEITGERWWADVGRKATVKAIAIEPYKGKVGGWIVTVEEVLL